MKRTLLLSGVVLISCVGSLRWFPWPECDKKQRDAACAQSRIAMKSFAHRGWTNAEFVSSYFAKGYWTIVIQTPPPAVDGEEPKSFTVFVYQDGPAIPIPNE